MASSAAQLAALGNDGQFQQRVRSLLLQQAEIVWAEAPGTPDTRRIFAKSLLNNTDQALRLALVVANGTNVIAGNVTFDWLNNRPVTDVTDAAMTAQIAATWSMLAGV